jgi:Restriction endonuclease NotI
MTRRLPETYLAEIFGFPADIRDPDVEVFRGKCLCPFRPLRADAQRDLSLPDGQVPFEEQFARCTKNSVTQPLGVCSVFSGQKPAITCPVRFGESGVMLEAATS